MVQTDEEKKISKVKSQHKYYLKKNTFFKDEQKKRYNKSKDTMKALLDFKAQHENVPAPVREVIQAPIIEEPVQELPARFRPGYSKASSSTAQAALALPRDYYPRKANGTPELLFQPCYDLMNSKEVGRRCLKGTISSGNLSNTLQNIRTIYRQGLGEGKEGDDWKKIDLWPILNDIPGKFRKLVLNTKTLEKAHYAATTYRGFVISISNMLLILRVPLSEKQKLDLQILWFNLTILSELTSYKSKHSPTRSILDYNIFMERARQLSLRENEKVYITIASMFKENVFRKEMVNLVLVSSNDETTDKSKNYVIVSEKSNSLAEFQINSYKTKATYGVNTGLFSLETTAVIRDYIQSKRIAYGGKFFKNCEGDLRVLITKIDAKDPTIAGSEGCFNYMRHSILSSAAVGVTENWDKLLIFSRVIHSAKHGSEMSVYQYIYNVHS